MGIGLHSSFFCRRLRSAPMIYDEMSPRSFTALGLVVVLTSGCRIFIDNDEPLGKSLLRPAAASPDSVAMEIIWARFAAGDPELMINLREIDETQVAPAVRRELAHNGFRVGVIGRARCQPQLPALRSGKTSDNEPSTGDSANTATLIAEPVVHGRIQQFRCNQRSEIQASDIYLSVPLLSNGGRELSGRTYSDAQAMYALRVDSQSDQTAIVELTPELHLGPARLRLTRDDDDMGMMPPTSLARTRGVQPVAHVGSARTRRDAGADGPSRRGQPAGTSFHNVESAEGPQQKLILIRLAEVPSSDMFEID